MTITQDLLVAFTPDDDADLRRELAVRADDADLLDVAYRIIDSPLGPLLLAATPVGLVRIAFALEDHDRVLQHLADDVSPRVLAAPHRLDAVARELDEYFTGRRRRFDVRVDLRLAHGFRRDVLDELRGVPYGSTVSYAALAAAAGRPRAVRAAGGACSHNPIPLVVPCHRVVRTDGSVGNYLAGRAAKESLLALEHATPG
jgi:methylated-DNA-[protein]-cysteine S-methyltransferase